MNEIATNKHFNLTAPSIPGAIKFERLGFASGVIFSLLQFGVMGYFITLVFPQMGPPEAVELHLAFYRNQGEVLRLGNYLLMLPMPFFLLFLGGLFGLLRRMEGSSGPLAVSAITSGTIVAVLWPLSAVLNNVGIDIAQAGGDRATVTALDAIGPYTLALSALPRAVLLVAVSAGLIYGRFKPGWISWAGLALAMITLAGSATLVTRQIFPVLALGTMLFELWIVALSLTVLLKKQAS